MRSSRKKLFITLFPLIAAFIAMIVLFWPRSEVWRLYDQIRTQPRWMEWIRYKLSRKDYDKIRRQAWEKLRHKGIEAIPPLLKLAKNDRYSENRETALRYLSCYDDPRVLSCVWEIVRKKSQIGFFEKALHVYGFFDTPKITPNMIKLFKKSKNPNFQTDFQSLLVEALGRINSRGNTPEITSVLIQTFKNNANGNLRICIAKALRQNSNAVPILIQAMLNDSNLDVRNEALLSLEGIDNDKLNSAFLSVIENESLTFAKEVKTMEKMRNSKIPPEHLDHLRKTSENMRIRTAGMICKPKKDESIERLLKIVENDKSRIIRIWAAQALAQTKDPKIISKLDKTINEAKSRDHILFFDLLWISSKLDYDRLKSECYGILSNRSLPIPSRLMASKIIRVIDNEINSKQIRRMLEIEKNIEIQAALINILGNSNDVNVIPELLKRIRKGNPSSIREAAINALGVIIECNDHVSLKFIQEEIIPALQEIIEEYNSIDSDSVRGNQLADTYTGALKALGKLDLDALKNPLLELIEERKIKKSAKEEDEDTVIEISEDDFEPFEQSKEIITINTLNKFINPFDEYYTGYLKNWEFCDDPETTAVLALNPKLNFYSKDYASARLLKIIRIEEGLPTLSRSSENLLRISLNFSEDELFNLLAKKDWDLSEFAAMSLGMRGHSVSCLKLSEIAISNKEKFHRRISIAALDKIGDPKALPTFFELLKNSRKDLEILIDSIRALGNLASAKAIPVLSNILEQDKRIEIRNSIIESFSKIDSRNSIPALKKLRNETISRDLRDSAGFVLAQLGEKIPESSYEIILKRDLSYYDSAFMREIFTVSFGDKVLRVLRNCPKEQSVRFFSKKALESPVFDFRYNAIDALRVIKSPKAIPALLKVAKTDSNPKIRFYAVMALAEIDPSQAWPVIKAALRDFRISPVHYGNRNFNRDDNSRFQHIGKSLIFEENHRNKIINRWYKLFFAKSGERSVLLDAIKELYHFSWEDWHSWNSIFKYKESPNVTMLDFKVPDAELLSIFLKTAKAEGFYHAPTMSPLENLSGAETVSVQSSTSNNRESGVGLQILQCSQEREHVKLKPDPKRTWSTEYAPEAAAKLADVLDKARNPATRWAAILALKVLNQPENVPILIEAYKRERFAALRHAFIKALEKANSIEAVDFLVKEAASTRETNWRGEIINSLQKMNAKLVCQRVKEQLPKTKHYRARKSLEGLLEEDKK